MRRTSNVVARVDVASGYDLVLSMGAAAADEASPGAAALRRAAPDTAEGLRAFAQSDWMWAHLVTLVEESPAPRDPEAVLAHLAVVPSREVLRRLLGYYVRWFRRMTPPETIDHAIRGNAEARREVLRTSQPDDPLWRSSVAARLEAGPERTKRELLALAAEWLERAFVPVLGRSDRQRRAAASVSRRAAGGSGAVELASAFLGWEYVPEPGIARVVIVPSLVLSAVHEFEHEQTKYVCVPVSHEPQRPPAALVRTVRALADDSRLAIVTALARGDLGAQELADRTGLGLPTVLHHLRTLRDARLVAGGGRRREYRLGRTALRTLGGRIASLARPAGRSRHDRPG